MNDVIIIGADIEIIEVILDNDQFKITGIVDNNISGEYYGYRIIGDDKYFLKEKEKYLSSALVITLDDVMKKMELYKIYKKHGFSFVNIISRKSVVSQFVKLSEGVIIQNGVNIGAGVSLGKLSKINVNANVMHNGVIGDFNTLAPNCVTLGYIKTGTNTFIGANATILPNCKIGNNVLVGAGSVVTKNLEDGWIYTGCPAKKLKPIS